MMGWDCGTDLFLFKVMYLTLPQSEMFYIFKFSCTGTHNKRKVQKFKLSDNSKHICCSKGILSFKDFTVLVMRLNTSVQFDH